MTTSQAASDIKNWLADGSWKSGVNLLSAERKNAGLKLESLSSGQLKPDTDIQGVKVVFNPEITLIIGFRNYHINQATVIGKPT